MASVPRASESWEEFVRETLTRLQDDLASGELTLNRPMSNSRLLLSGPARNICLPTCELSLEPAPRIARSHKGLLSPLTVTTHNSPIGKVNVPWHAIVRNHNRLLSAVEFQGCCRQCQWEDCAHGWPRDDVFDLKTIVVLRVRHDDEWMHAWYVRFDDAPTELVRVPPPVVEWITSRIETQLIVDGSDAAPSLIRKFNDCSLTEQDFSNFNGMCCVRFIKYRERVRQRIRLERANAVTRDERATELSRKRKAPSPVWPDDLPTCVVCLEDRPTAQSRCSNKECHMRVCEVCHKDARGFCPVCDRSAINAEYPCSSCHKFHTLRDYGYACMCCGAHSLCRGCHVGYRECASCECADTPSIA